MLKSYVNSTSERVEELSRLGQENKKRKERYLDKVRKRKERRWRRKWMEEGEERATHQLSDHFLGVCCLPHPQLL